MRAQLDLLRETPWGALLVLDACRVDAFADEADANAETVTSPGCNTSDWLAAVAPLLRARDVTCFAANPIVDRENARHGLGLRTVPLHEWLWGRWTDALVPSVHPQAVVGYVLGCQPAPPIVVHFIQPHSPYIGSAPLAMSRWGHASDRFGSACHALERPDRAVARGAVAWDDVREAYRANLGLVWRAARHLAERLRTRGMRVVVTSDHGELLGEGGRFGHEPGWDFPELRRVPWLDLGTPRAVRSAIRNPQSAIRRLEALGYA